MSWCPLFSIKSDEGTSMLDMEVSVVQRNAWTLSSVFDDDEATQVIDEIVAEQLIRIDTHYYELSAPWEEFG